MAKKSQSSFAPASDTEAAEILRGKVRSPAPQIIAPASGSDALSEDRSPDDAPAMTGVPAAPPPDKPTIPPADAGKKPAEATPTPEPEVHEEVTESRRRLRPEQGPDGKALFGGDALEAAIDAGEKAEAEKAAADIKAKLEKEAADKKASDEATAAGGRKPDADKPDADTAAAAAKPAVAVPVDTEASDEALIEGLKPNSQRKIRLRMAKLREVETKLADAEKKIQELSEKTLAPEGDPKAKEELETLRATAARLTRLHELEADPEIKEKFDKPADEAELAIIDLLKNHGIGEPTLNLVKEIGGFAAFSKSTKKFSVTVDGEDRDMTAAEMAKNWTERMGVGDTALLQDKLNTQTHAREGKKAFVEAETKKAREYYTKQDADKQAFIKKVNDDYDAWAAKAVAIDSLKDKPIPADASEAEKKELTRQNEYRKQIREIPGSIKKFKTLADLQQMVSESMQFHIVRIDLVTLRAELEAAKELLADRDAELVKVREGLSTTGKSGSIRPGAGGPPREKEAKKVDPRTVNSADALEAAIEKGQREAAANE
jgi:hypothetical protein